jgi:hypothetical protein
MDPVEAEKWSKVLNGYHEAHWKPIMEQAYAADKVWRLANKDMIEAKEAAWEKLIKDGKVFKEMNDAKAKSSKDNDGSKDDKGDA